VESLSSAAGKRTPLLLRNEEKKRKKEGKGKKCRGSAVKKEKRRRGDSLNLRLTRDVYSCNFRGEEKKKKKKTAAVPERRLQKKGENTALSVQRKDLLLPCRREMGKERGGNWHD